MFCVPNPGTLVRDQKCPFVCPFASYAISIRFQLLFSGLQCLHNWDVQEQLFLAPLSTSASSFGYLAPPGQFLMGDKFFVGTEKTICMNMNYKFLTAIFRIILTQIYYVFLVLFTVFQFDLEKFISKNCKYIFFYQNFCTFG